MGDLLLWRSAAPQQTIQLGRLTIEAAERADAMFVVDGQQRVTSLANVLLHPSPSSDIFSLWFDLEELCFVRPGRKRILPHWIPLNKIIDTVELGTWWFENNALAQRNDLLRIALELSKSIREFHLPAYIVETDDEESLRIIFTRMNTSGAKMLETEVFAALHFKKGQPRPLEVLQRTAQEHRMCRG